MDNDISSMEVMARLTGIKIEIKEVINEWLLLTYDMPHSEEGDKARREFLQSARAIGAAQQTESVYLIPWTPEAETLALDLSRQVQVMKRGKVIIWTSTPTDKAKAAEITETYDAGLEPLISDIEERLGRIEEHQAKKRYLRAEKMLAKTNRMLENLRDAVMRRGSMVLFLRLQILQHRFATVN